jgi:hypothetical protein
VKFSEIARSCGAKKVNMKSELTNFQTEVGEWATKTFPNSNIKSKISHLKKEVIELEEAGDDAAAAEECVDCFLILLHIAEQFQFDLLTEARAKMDVNRKRVWGKPDKDGVVEHIKENSDSLVPRVANAQQPITET